VRYWAALGIQMRGAEAVRDAREALIRALGDASPSVRAAAAEALGRYSDDSDLNRALEVLMQLAPIDKNGLYISLLALNALDTLDKKAASLKERIQALPREDASVDPKLRGYVPRLLEKTLADL
jgi:uncharacterized sulfatase